MRCGPIRFHLYQSLNGRGRLWAFWCITPWFRFGIRKDDGWPALFSERYGFAWVRRIRNVVIEYKPAKSWYWRFKKNDLV